MSAITGKSLRDMYTNREHLIKTALVMYKYLVKSNDELLSTAHYKPSELNINIPDTIKTTIIEQQHKLFKSNHVANIVKEKLKILPIIVEFCYIYYVHYFDDNAPLYKIPKHAAKYALIISALHANLPKYDKCNNAFISIINNEFIQRVSMANAPPIYIERDSIEEIQTQINEVTPLIKNVFDSILHLDIVSIPL